MILPGPRWGAFLIMLRRWYWHRFFIVRMPIRVVFFCGYFLVCILIGIEDAFREAGDYYNEHVCDYYEKE